MSLSKEEIKDYNYWFERVKQDGWALYYVPKEYKTYELCLEAVKQYGYALKHVSEEHKTRKLCLEAIKQDGRALEYVPEKHKTYEFCLEAVKQDGRALDSVPEEYKTYEICLEAVKQAGWALEYVPEKYKTKELQLIALKQDKRAINYINTSTLPISEWHSEWFKDLWNIELHRQFIRERGAEVIDQLGCIVVEENKEYKLVKYKVVKNQDDFNKALIFKCPSSGDLCFSEVPDDCRALKEALEFFK